MYVYSFDRRGTPYIAETHAFIVAVMSRPVAGTRNGSLIITLPGSPKGAKENLQSIIKMLPHACLQAQGGDSRSMHVGGTDKLEKDAGISSSASTQGTRYDRGDLT